MKKFSNKKYKTIYIDPPWPEYGGGKIKRGADRHYLLMTLQEIYDLNISDLAEDSCHLYLWTTNNFFPFALEAIKIWNFNYKTCITWAKNRIGLGQYFRGQTEHCLFATTGDAMPYRIREDGKRAQGRTLLIPDEAFNKTRKHSQKPDGMRKMIEVVSYPPYIELFARQKTEGWDVWGNEV